MRQDGAGSIGRPVRRARRLSREAGNARNERGARAAVDPAGPGQGARDRPHLARAGEGRPAARDRRAPAPSGVRGARRGRPGRRGGARRRGDRGQSALPRLRRRVAGAGLPIRMPRMCGRRLGDSRRSRTLYRVLRRRSAPSRAKAAPVGAAPVGQPTERRRHESPTRDSREFSSSAGEAEDRHSSHAAEDRVRLMQRERDPLASARRAVRS